MRGAKARYMLARIHRQHRGTEIMSGVSVFVCEENRSFLTISPSPLHKPPLSRGHMPFVQRTKRGSPVLFVLAFME